MHTNSTLKSVLIDRLHDEASDRETRWIACQEAARLHADAVESISRTYTFARDTENCRLSPEGVITQAAMKLTRKAVPAETLTVVCKMDDGGDTLWFLTDVSAAHFPAAAYIAAVERRVNRNRAVRVGGAN